MCNPCSQPIQILFCLSCAIQFTFPAALYILKERSVVLMHNNFSPAPIQTRLFLSANKTGVKDDSIIFLKESGSDMHLLSARFITATPLPYMPIQSLL